MTSDSVVGPLPSSSTMRLGPAWRKGGEGYFNQSKRAENGEHSKEIISTDTTTCLESAGLCTDTCEKIEKESNCLKITLSASTIVEKRYETVPAPELTASLEVTQNLISIEPLPPLTIIEIDEAEVTRLWNLGTKNTNHSNRLGRQRSDSEKQGKLADIDGCRDKEALSGADDLWDDPIIKNSGHCSYDETFDCGEIISLNLEDMAAQSGKFRLEMEKMAERAAKLKLHEEKEESERKLRAAISDSKSTPSTPTDGIEHFNELRPLTLAEIEGNDDHPESPSSALEISPSTAYQKEQNSESIAAESLEQKNFSPKKMKPSSIPPIDVGLPVEIQSFMDESQSTKNATSASRDEILNSLGLLSPNSDQQLMLLEAQRRMLIDQQRRMQAQELTEIEQRRKRLLWQQLTALQQKYQQQLQHIESQYTAEFEHQMNADTQRRLQQKHMQQQIQQQQYRFQQLLSRGASVEPWHYLDPQGSVQGPFSAHDMREWFNAGYFNENLLIRQGTSGEFHSLSQLFPSASHAFAVSATAERELSRLEKLKNDYHKFENQRQDQLRMAQHRLDQIKQEQLRLSHAQADEFRLFKETVLRQEAMKMEQLRAEQEDKKMALARLRLEQEQKSARAAITSPWSGVRSPSNIWGVESGFEPNAIGGDAQNPSRVILPMANRHASPPTVPLGFQTGPHIHDSSPKGIVSKVLPRAVGGPNWPPRSSSPGGMPRELAAWVQDELVKLGRGAQDMSLLEFCMNVSDPSETQEVIVRYMGSSPQVVEFAKNYVQRRAASKSSWTN